MSKAFIKEDDNENASDETDLELDAELDLDEDFQSEDDDESSSAKVLANSQGKNYITPQGHLKLRSEYENLVQVERPKVVETVAWAASNGDRSENADYIYGKRRLREIDRRIHFLSKRLDKAVVVDPALQKSDRVLFGATVKVVDEEGEERTYKIVGADEANAHEFCISWNSPVGRALLQTQVGDVVEVKLPKGRQELEVLEITYKAIFE